MNKRTEEEQVYSGRLGRTSKTSVLISSHAGPVFPATVYTSVNITHDEGLRADLESGRLNEVACPFDDHTYSLSIPVRYHDEANAFFALIIPESLRHEEFKHRSELLQELSKEREILPDYVRNFHTVFSFEQLQQILGQVSKKRLQTTLPGVVPDETSLSGKTETFGLHASLGLSEESSSVLRSPPKEDAALLKAKEELEQERLQLSQSKAELELQQTQLNEVSTRLERERERMEEIEMSISTERSEIEAARQEMTQMRDALLMEKQQLDALKLNLEQKQHHIESHQIASPDEKTQVVTDDQFIEVLMSEAEDDEDSDHDVVLDESEILAEEKTQITASQDILTSVSLHSDSPHHESLPDDDFAEDEATQITQVPSLDHISVTAEFDASRAGAHNCYVSRVEGGVVASARASRKAVNAVLDAEPVLFMQHAVINDYPVAVILLATLKDQQLHKSFGWLLDLGHDEDRKIFEQLEQHTAVRFAFYNRQNKLMRTFDIKAPLEANMTWIREQIQSRLSEVKVSGFSNASEAFFAKDFERLGTMRHTFTHTSFEDIATPEQAKLAAGIVGYWSTPDILEYLIGNRSFPLSIFRSIQSRVASAALNLGIYLNKELRQVVLDAHMVDSPRALSRRLMANFAEVSIGLKPSDLDPLEIWENWDALLELAEEVGAQPEQDVIELAQASLRKAKEFQEDPQVGEHTLITTVPLAPPAGAPLAMALKLPELKPNVVVDELVVAKRSENTGVTYFLPDDAVLEQFDDMASMSKEDLLLLLDDSSGRLEASQVLIERFGAEVIADVLKASEEMLAAEVVGLAKFMESRADGLETELVLGVEAGGPSATYIATYALAHIRSTSSLPVLLEALRDNKRSGNRRALAEALSRYEDKMLPALMNLIKRKGHDEALLDVLVALEARKPNTLSKLSKDRHRRVREAGKAGRKRLK